MPSSTNWGIIVFPSENCGGQDKLIHEEHSEQHLAQAEGCLHNISDSSKNSGIVSQASIRRHCDVNDAIIDIE